MPMVLQKLVEAMKIRQPTVFTKQIFPLLQITTVR